MNFSRQTRLHILLPIVDNEGNKIPQTKFIKVYKRFRTDFGGYTTILPPSKGEWVSEGIPYPDFHVGCEVIIKEERFLMKVKPTLQKMISEFEKDFKQKLIACYYHDVTSNVSIKQP